MKYYKDLECVQAVNNNNTLIFTYVVPEEKEIKEIKFHLDRYDNVKKKYVKDKKQKNRVIEWLRNYYGIDNVDDIQEAVGLVHDIFDYETFCSLWETEVIQKFTEDMVGKIITCTITDIMDDGNRILIKYEYDGDIYQSKMNYSQWLIDGWYIDSIKKKRQFENFEKKFGVPFEQRESLIGKDINVEVKQLSEHFFGDIKKL